MRPDEPLPLPATHGGSTTIGSPIEALERGDLLRTRRICTVGTAIAVPGTIAVVQQIGDPTKVALLLVAFGVSLGAVLFLYIRTGDLERYRRPSTLIGWYIPALCITTALPFFGVFSPAPLVLVLAIYFTGLGRSGRLSLAVYLTCAGAQAIVAALVILGTIRDAGMIQIKPLSAYEQWIVQGLVQVVLLATYVTARISRTTALAALEELERAVRVAGHREALLLEAREELGRALRSGRGRFTDQTIGRYQLGAVLGKGAMGEVYAAVDGAGQEVAIKLLSQASLGNRDHVLRFLRELRTAAGIDSPHVVRVIEVGEQPVPYLVMEKLDGQTLSERLRDRRALPPIEVVDLVRQVGAGITAAGAAGIIHRDLKPQNVFLHRGTWKVLDFGVARMMDAGDTLTAGYVVGTPSYMSPEQAAGGAVDHATDLYALAAITYRAITGQPPFPPGEIAETLYKVVHGAPRRPGELADLPAQLDLVLAIGLAKDPGDRFGSAAELADALAAAFAGVLSPPLAERGAALVQRGAWAAARSHPPIGPIRRSAP